MNQFSRGQKGKLSDLGLTDAFTVTLDLQPTGFGADVSCFGLDAQDKLADDRYMVFYNQKAAPHNSIVFDQLGTRSSFALRLDLLPASVTKLVFAASTDGSTMRKLGASTLQLGNVLAFSFSSADFQDEKALIVGELYRRDGVWRFGAVGQGFNGGLSSLLKHFGGTEADADPRPTSPVIVQPPPLPPKPVSLSKITLEKRGEKISLEKSVGGGFGRIRINLNWNDRNQAAPRAGLLSGLFGDKKRDSGGIDLDLGCLYELADGSKGVVQALGNLWGNLDHPPYVTLDGDDRSGKVSTGENLTVNGRHFDQIKRILVFGFIYDGVPNWAATDGVVIIDSPNQPPIEVRLDNGGSEGMCAIAMIENSGGALEITKLGEYFRYQGQVSFHEAMDRRYRFGLEWVTASKD
jgi:tellurite resistance protein TerA